MKLCIQDISILNHKLATNWGFTWSFLVVSGKCWDGTWKIHTQSFCVHCPWSSHIIRCYWCLKALLKRNWYTVWPSKCQIRNEASNLRSEDVIMCCLVSVTTPQKAVIDDYEAMVEWWLASQCETCSSATSSITDLTWSYVWFNQGSVMRSQHQSAWEKTWATRHYSC
jgi:hypothetical protein